MKLSFNPLKKFLDILSANGKKRKQLAIGNVIIMIFAGLAIFVLLHLWTFYADWSYNIDISAAGDNLITVFGCWLGLAVLFVASAVFTLTGVFAQFVMLFVALIGSFTARHEREKGDNRVAFIVALLSLIAAVTIVLVVLFVFVF